MIRLSFWLSLVLFFTVSCSSKQGKTELQSIDDLHIEISEIEGQVMSFNGPPSRGSRLLEKHCQSCHQLPQIQVYPKSYWNEDIMPRMGALLGMHHKGFPYDKQVNWGIEKAAYHNIKAANIYPDSALIDSLEWYRLVSFIDSLAPREVAYPRNFGKAPNWFSTETIPFKKDPPLITYLKVDEVKKEILVSDLRSAKLHFLNFNFEEKLALQLTNAVTDVQYQNGKLWCAMPSEFFASDNPIGQLSHFNLGKGGKPEALQIPKMTGLNRPQHFVFHDINEDGFEDIIVSELGDQTGQLTLFLGTGDNGYVKKVMVAESGFDKLAMHDVNGDGKKELVALQRAGKNSIQAFYYEGNGNFKREIIRSTMLHQIPSDFQFADFDGDGLDDLLIIVGQKGRGKVINRSADGCYLYRNQANGHFEPERMGYQAGATKAVCADFDGDGDLDIVSIAYYPNYKRMWNSVMLFENNGKQRFGSYQIRELGNTRWRSIDVGDIDDDADQDVILGAFIFGDDEIGADQLQKWREESPTLMLLRNSLN